VGVADDGAAADALDGAVDAGVVQTDAALRVLLGAVWDVLLAVAAGGVEEGSHLVPPSVRVPKLLQESGGESSMSLQVLALNQLLNIVGHTKSVEKIDTLGPCPSTDRKSVMWLACVQMRQPEHVSACFLRQNPGTPPGYNNIVYIACCKETGCFWAAFPACTT
jgi:hypothetical protein